MLNILFVLPIEWLSATFDYSTDDMLPKNENDHFYVVILKENDRGELGEPRDTNRDSMLTGDHSLGYFGNNEPESYEEWRHYNIRCFLSNDSEEKVKR